MKKENNENVYDNFGISATEKEIACGGVEWVKCGTLRWFGHMIRMGLLRD